MVHVLTQFAAGDLLGALGIDWQMLLFQVLGFAVLVWLMAKFVYPPLLKVIDERQEKIEASTKAVQEAEEKASKASDEISKMLKQARQEASEIMITAKEEASALAQQSEARSKQEAERIVASAQDEISKEVLAAKRALHNETIELVASATEKVVGKTVNLNVDNKVIADALKESK